MKKQKKYDYLISFTFNAKGELTPKAGHATITMNEKLSKSNFYEVIDYLKEHGSDGEQVIILSIYEF